MAKPQDITPEQEAKIRASLGLPADKDLTGLYGVLSEDRIRELAGVSTPKAAPVSTPTLAPKPIKPASVTKVGEGIAASGPTQVQPESGMIPRLSYGATSGQERIDKALAERQKAVAEKSLSGPAQLRLSPEDAAKALEYGKRIATEPRTVTGERRTLTPTPTTMESLFGTGLVGTTLSGIMPQVIETPEQAKARDDEARIQTDRYFKSLGPGSYTPANYRKVFDSFRYHGGVGGDTSLTTPVSFLKEVFTSKTPTGATIESPIATAGKILGAGESAIVSGAEYAGQLGGAALAKAKGLPSEAIKTPEYLPLYKEQLKSGSGLMGAGYSSGSKAAELLGAPKPVQELVGYSMGTAGFLSGLFIPADLGASSAATTALKTAETVSEIGKGVSAVSKLDVAKAAATGGKEGLFDAWRITGGRTGGLNTVSSELQKATERWLANPEVNRVTNVTVRLASEPAVHAAIAADKEAGSAAAKVVGGVYDQSPYLDALEVEFNKLKSSATPSDPIHQYADFASYLSDAEAHGIDILNSSGMRASINEKPPTSVVPKEVKESLQKTSAGRTSLDYFDQLATGERSNLYFNAYLDSLDPVLKEKLLAGGAVKSSEFLPAFDRLVNEVRRSAAEAGKSEAEVVNALIPVRAQLERMGIKIPQERFMGATAAGTLGTTYGGLFITPATEAAITKSYKLDLGKRLLNDFAGATGITGRTLKVGDITLSAKEAAEVIDSVKKNKTIESIRSRFLDKSYKGGEIPVTPAELKELRDYYITPFTKAKTLEGAYAEVKAFGVKEPKGQNLYIRPTTTYSPFNIANTLGRIEKTGVISGTQYNELVQSALALESSTKITGKTSREIGAITSKLAAGDKASQLSYFVRNVMTPKDLQESGLAAIMIDTSKKVTTPTTKSQVANEIISEVNGRMGSLGDRFKLKMRTKMSANVPRPEAFAETMIEEFTTEGVYKPIGATTAEGAKPIASEVIQRPFEVARAGEARTIGEISFAKKQGAYEMYRTYIASIYGGYEQTIDAISTTGRNLDLDKMAIATKEMRDLVTVLMDVEGSLYNTRYLEFEAAVTEMAGTSIEALNILQRTHIDLFGYSIQETLTKRSGIAEDMIEKKLQEAVSRAQERVGNEALPFFSGATSEYRGIKEAYNAASQQGVLFRPENFKEMLIGTYYTKAQANVIDDVLLKAQQKYPEIFPSAATLGQIGLDDWQVARNGMVSVLDKKAALPPNLGGLTPEQLAVYQNLRKELIGETGIATKQVVKTDRMGKPILDAAGNKITVLQGVSLEAKEQKMAEDLLIAAVQDKVGSVSGTGAKKNYLSTLKENFSGVGDATETKLRNQLLGIGYDGLETKPGSTYSSIFDSQARSDATALFYQTSLTNLRNQLKTPYAASLQGVAEKVMTVPLLKAEETAIKKPLFYAANVKRTTETIQSLQLMTGESKLNQVIAKDGIAFSEQIADMQDLVDGIAARELSEPVTKFAAKKEQVLKDIKNEGVLSYRRVILDALATPIPYIFTGNIAKNGLLGGLLLPNLTYAFGNFLSGPAIVTATLGLERGTKAMTSVFNRDTVDILRYLYAPNFMADSLERVVVTAPDGQIYTTSMLAEMVNNGSIGRSQATAELTNELINSAVDWAGKTGLYGDKAEIAKSIRRNFININDTNAYSTAANAVDQLYRTRVLKDALAEGEPLANAQRLARESLFDYGNLSSAEKSVIGKTIWFWTFARNNYRSVFTSLATDPRALKAAFASGKGWQYVYNVGETLFGLDPQDVDVRYSMKDYSENRMLIDLIEDPEFKKRYATYGPPVPELQAVSELIDYLSIPAGFIASETGLSKEPYGLQKLGYEAGQAYLSRANPVVQGAAAAFFGVDIRREGKPTSAYLDPKFMWYVQQNPSQFYTFSTMFNIEAVPYDEEQAGVGYYDGHQWRINQSDAWAIRKWNVLKALTLQIGVDRTMRDYAPLFESTKALGTRTIGSAFVAPALTLLQSAPKLPEAAKGETTLPPSLHVDQPAIEFWRSVGVITIQDAPMLEEIQRRNRMEAAKEIKTAPIKQ